MKKHILIVGLALIGSLNAADIQEPATTSCSLEILGLASQDDVEEDDVYSFDTYPKDDPYVVFVKTRLPDMRMKVSRQQSGLLILQSHSCDEKQLSTLFAALIKALKKDKELTNQNTFEYATTLPLPEESTFALTWIRQDGEVFMKNYTRRPLLCSVITFKPQHIILHKCQAHHSLFSSDYDLQNELTAVKAQDKAFGLIDLAQHAQMKLQQDENKPSSFVLVDYTKYQEQKDENCTVQ